jgi:predicted aldo/keto reductase-like oxidoreductase
MFYGCDDLARWYPGVPERGANTTDEKPARVSRRTLIKGAATVAAGSGAAAALYAAWKNSTYLFLIGEAETHARQPKSEWQGASVQGYRPLGNTGISMSDISFGGAGIGNPDVVTRAVERGINYFDTSPDYSRTGSEQVIGKALKPHRDKVHIASKFCTADGHLPPDTPVRDIVAAVEGSLQRLQTDYLDVGIIHEVNTIERLMAPTFHEAFDRLREQGKVRFLGVSSHTPNLEAVMRHAVDSGRFNMLLVAYNFNNWPDLTTIFHDARQRGIGVVGMKTLKGAKASVLKDFADQSQAFSQAAFKWVLSNPDVSGLVVSINDFDQVDEYLFASGKSPTDDDVALLERYDARITREYCRPGCGACLSSCPYDVPVDDIFRYAMYFENYGQQRNAMAQYATIAAARNASRCLGCPAPCEAACPFEIPIREKMLHFHPLLTPT